MWLSKAFHQRALLLASIQTCSFAYVLEESCSSCVGCQGWDTPEVNYSSDVSPQPRSEVPVGCLTSRLLIFFHVIFISVSKNILKILAWCHFAGRGLKNEIRQVKCIRNYKVQHLCFGHAGISGHEGPCVNQWAHKQEIMELVFRFGICGAVEWLFKELSSQNGPQLKVLQEMLPYL